MRCEHIEPLIPLYVGGDLEPHEVDDVRQHLNSCAPCRQLHEEFQASQQWLTGVIVPKFDEASFAKLRASVLQEIERQEKRGSWLDRIEWLLPKWNPRLMLASATIALAITTGLVTTIYHQQQIPAKGGNEAVAKMERRNGADLVNAVTGRTSSGNTQIATALHTGSQRKRQAASKLLPPEAFTNQGFSNALEPPVIPEEAIVAESPAATQPGEKEKEQEMLRIEIQTADPNIRIIWLTPKADGHLNPNEK